MASLKTLLAGASAAAETAAATTAAGSGFVPVPRERLRPLALFLAVLPVGRRHRIPEALFTPEDLNVKSGADAGRDLGYRMRKSVTDVFSAVDGGMKLHESHEAPPFLWVSDFSQAGDTAPTLAVRDSIPRKTAERMARKGIEAGPATMALPLTEAQASEVLKTFGADEKAAFLAALEAYAAEVADDGADGADDGDVF